MLYIIATPIGNLEDITLRALRILKEVDYILCEDTRVTRKLLAHYKIKKLLISYHQYTSEKKIHQIIKLIKDHKVAIVTDAGTPGISDPNILTPFRGGQKTLAKASMNFKIIPIPGPSAITTALSISGLPADKFLFLGFMPHKKGRQKFLREILESKRTVIFYESPHRIIKCLEQLNILINTDKNTDKHGCVEKRLVVCRELTKKFETIYRGSVEDVLEKIKRDFPNGKPRGEFVVVIR